MTDEQFRAWMRDNLARAAQHFGLVVHGEPRWGWCLRSISSAAAGPHGPCWLRVGSEQDRWLAEPDLADFWTGIPDANAITGVSKPVVLASTEWEAPDQQRRVRADVMTKMTGLPCSPTDALRTLPALPDSWWVQLRRSIDLIRATPTTRYATRSASAGTRVRQVFGDRVADAMRPTEWETTHGDLHWSNVIGPECGILDWELWGPGPVGADPATLYLFGLLVPAVAGRVAEVFADVLDCPAGRVAQICVASRILFRASEGENPDLADAVRKHVQPLVESARVA
jgi:hypothetical protein